MFQPVLTMEISFVFLYRPWILVLKSLLKYRIYNLCMKYTFLILGKKISQYEQLPNHDKSNIRAFLILYSFQGFCYIRTGPLREVGYATCTFGTSRKSTITI